MHRFYSFLASFPKVDSTNDDTQDSIFESNPAAAAKAGNATGMNRAETKPNKNKSKLNITDLMAKSEDKVRHEPKRLDHSDGNLVFSVIVSPGGQVYELPAPLQVSRDKAVDDGTSPNG